MSLQPGKNYAGENMIPVIVELPAQEPGIDSFSYVLEQWCPTWGVHTLGGMQQDV